MTTKIYSPWIKWDGGGCPVPFNTVVEAKLRCGLSEPAALAKNYYWNYDDDDDDGDIVSYRTVTEQADLDAAEQLLRASGYTVTPPAKPLTFEDVVPMTEAPPKGTEYWAVNSFSKGGVENLRWLGTSFNEVALRHRMAYLEKEHALIAARHIFGLKGGEL